MAQTTRPQAPDFAPAGVRRLQHELRLSDSLIDMLTTFAAIDALGTAANPTAIAVLKILADRNVPLANAELATVYFKGAGVVVDDAAAMTYLRKAADQGQGMSRFKLAKLLKDGVLADREQAQELATLAARDGVSGAADYAKSMGISAKSIRPAGGDLMRMALAGDPKVVNLAKRFTDDKIASGYYALAWYGAKHSRDAELKSEAPDLARKAAGLGLTDAFYVLSMLYQDGAVVERNLNEAFLWEGLHHRYCVSPRDCATEKKAMDAISSKIDLSSVDALNAQISAIFVGAKRAGGQ